MHWYDIRSRSVENLLIFHYHGGQIEAQSILLPFLPRLHRGEDAANEQYWLKKKYIVLLSQMYRITVCSLLSQHKSPMVCMQSRKNMSLKLLSIFLVLLHLLHISGCSTTKQSTQLPDELRYPDRGKIVKVVMKNGNICTFDKDGGKFIESVNNKTLHRGIFGVNANGQAVDMSIDSVLEVQVERQEANVVGTVLLITLGIPVVLLAAAVVALTINPPHSCPYVYSFDGTRYIFDAQAYAGAISRALKRTDYVRLDSLKPVDGRYHLIFRNDPTDETQYTDEVKLMVVDHEPQARVIYGYDGTLYTVKNLQDPLIATDRAQGNVTRFFSAQDGAAWQSEMPVDSSFKQSPLRDQLTFAFPKPKNVRSAALFLHGGTSYWGSSMIKQFIGMRGNRVYDWYEGLARNGPEQKELFQLVDGQELYHLKMYVGGGRRAMGPAGGDS